MDLGARPRRGRLPRSIVIPTRNVPHAGQVAAATALMLIAARPIVDLAGQYEGTGINLGGIVGIAAAVAAGVHFILTPRGRPALVHVAVIAWVALMATATIALVAQGVPDTSAVGRLAVGFAPLLLITSRRALTHMRLDTIVVLAAVLVLAASLVPVVIAWSQYVGIVPYTYFDYLADQRVGRPSGGYFQPNSLARLTIFCALILVTLAHRYRIRPSLQIAAIAALGITTVITTHRTSILIFAIVAAAFASFGAIRWSRQRQPLRLRVHRRIAVIAVVGSGLAVGAIGLGLLSGAASAAAVSFEQSVAVITHGLSSISGFGEDYFLRGRGAIWSAVIDRYAAGGTLGMAFGLGFEPLEAHNDLLRILLMHGGVGALGFALLFVALFVEGIRRTSSLGRFTMCVLFGFLMLYGVPLHPTAYPFFMWLFFLTYLLVLVVHDRGTSDAARSPPVRSTGVRPGGPR